MMNNHNHMTTLQPIPQFLDACCAIGLEISQHELDQLSAYLYLLLETNKQFNLTAIKDPDIAWLRHILDSLSLLPFISDTKTVIDIGSGGGLPGIPLAITLPNIQFTLLEATTKKTRFLQSVADQLNLTNITVINDRAETLGQNPTFRQHFDAAVSRAIGKLNVSLELMLPLIRPNHSAFAMKGKNVESELDNCADALMKLGNAHIEIYHALPNIEDDAIIAQITKTESTPPQYPRLPGIPKQSPL